MVEWSDVAAPEDRFVPSRRTTHVGYRYSSIIEDGLECLGSPGKTHAEYLEEKERLGRNKRKVRMKRLRAEFKARVANRGRLFKGVVWGLD
jgi:hypothetical protein